MNGSLPPSRHGGTGPEPARSLPGRLRGVSSSLSSLLQAAVVTLALWMLSVQPTCTPKAGPCFRSLTSWASRRPRSVISYVRRGVTMRRPGPPARSASTDQIMELHDQGLTRNR
jgi:hypothetical protein